MGEGEGGGGTCRLKNVYYRAFRLELYVCKRFREESLFVPKWVDAGGVSESLGGL